MKLHARWRTPSSILLAYKHSKHILRPRRSGSRRVVTRAGAGGTVARRRAPAPGAKPVFCRIAGKLGARRSGSASSGPGRGPRVRSVGRAVGPGGAAACVASSGSARRQKTPISRKKLGGGCRGCVRVPRRIHIVAEIASGSRRRGIVVGGAGGRHAR